MMRTGLFIAIAILCASCRTDAQLDPIQTVPIIDTAEISAREDCLYREAARLLEPKGSPPTSLQNIAIAATLLRPLSKVDHATSVERGHTRAMVKKIN